MGVFPFCRSKGSDNEVKWFVGGGNHDKKQVELASVCSVCISHMYINRVPEELESAAVTRYMLVDR